MKNDLYFMIVDDETAIRKVNKMVLKNFYADCRIDEGSDGTYILEHAFLPYDIIITDLNMPKLNGLNALIKIREKGINTPALITTGNPQEVIPDIVYKKGASYSVPQVYAARLIIKPFFPYDLKNAIEDTLNLNRK
ncbi:MAG: response regulator [Nanoarchaeota archaeon]